MNKIAFYVEGQTEQLFLNKLIIEIAGIKRVSIKLQKFQGKGRTPIEVYPQTVAIPVDPNHFVLIFDCCGDGSVSSRIREDHTNLINQGYSKIIGIRDLFPLPISDLTNLINTFKNGVTRNGRTIIPPMPLNSKIIVAIREIEDWFISEHNHYQNIDSSLNLQLINTHLGINLSTTDLRSNLTSAADNLNQMYQLVGKSYKKDFKKVERTVEAIDYSNIYLTLSSSLSDLKLLIDKIDDFFS
ncbi:hypothetical protein SL053_002490 [Flavobacterium psychrophilum]|nr:hypothetical protein [Flavobacterium psychrophilum]